MRQDRICGAPSLLSNGNGVHLFGRFKWPGLETDHSHESSVYTSTRLHIFMEWCLVKHGDNFAFVFQISKQTLKQQKALTSHNNIFPSKQEKAEYIRTSRHVFAEY
jgi:hypothetical protein